VVGGDDSEVLYGNRTGLQMVWQRLEVVVHVFGMLSVEVLGVAALQRWCMCGGDSHADMVSMQGVTRSCRDKGCGCMITQCGFLGMMVRCRGVYVWRQGITVV